MIYSNRQMNVQANNQTNCVNSYYYANKIERNNVIYVKPKENNIFINPTSKAQYPHKIVDSVDKPRLPKECTDLSHDDPLSK